MNNTKTYIYSWPFTQVHLLLFIAIVNILPFPFFFLPILYFTYVYI